MVETFEQIDMFNSFKIGTNSPHLLYGDSGKKEIKKLADVEDVSSISVLPAFLCVHVCF